jgi:hypothetical protein
MNMSDRLEPILRLLDEGLSLYRRHFATFVLIAAGGFVPLAIAIGVLLAVGEWLDPLLAVAIGLGTAVLVLPLLIYVVGGVSRLALAAVEGRPVTLRDALAIRPWRAAGVGCFAFVYAIGMQVVSSVVSMACICPLYIFGFAVVGLLGANVEGSALGALGLGLLGILFGGVYLFALIVGGASYSSLIYALQPLVQVTLPFGDAVSQSIALVGYRFVHNIVAWGLSALLVAAAGLTVTLAVGVLVPLPVIFALGEESRIAQAIAGTAWLIGLVVVIPPLPIWMALLYKENNLARNGADLEASVREWEAASVERSHVER